MHRLSRRELGLIGVGALLGSAASPPARGRVGVARLSEKDGRVAPTEARSALELALAAATGLATGRDAARALFRSSDTVAIKLNCVAGPRMSPHPTLVAALAALLREAGVSAERIVAFDRSSRELRKAGFEVRREGGGYLCYGIDNDYESEPTTAGRVGACFARVARRCTALVSFGVVKDHGVAGVSAGLKNLYGLIHNPNKYHDNGCDYVADVLREVAGTLRLTVLDGVTAQCHGGPIWRPDAAFPLARVAVSTDPLAADAWAWREIDAERTRRGMPTLAEANRPPRFLATAERYGLGIGRLAAIAVVEA